MQKLQCPNCHQVTGSTVKATRLVDNQIRRIRLCEGCGKRFNTLELPEVELKLKLSRDIHEAEVRLQEFTELVQAYLDTMRKIGF